MSADLLGREVQNVLLLGLSFPMADVVVVHRLNPFFQTDCLRFIWFQLNEAPSLIESSDLLRVILSLPNISTNFKEFNGYNGN